VTVQVDSWVKAFPWRAYELDLGSLFAAVILRILIIFAFISPFQGVVKNIVTEKELRLREGMALLGLRSRAYWGSWFLTHFSTLVLSSVLMALLGMYPFQYTSPVIMLIFYLELSLAMISFGYFISTLFNRAQVLKSATNGMPDTENILDTRPIGCQTLRIYLTRDQ
jgi:hypothetical protein